MKYAIYIYNGIEYQGTVQDVKGKTKYFKSSDSAIRWRKKYLGADAEKYKVMCEINCKPYLKLKRKNKMLSLKETANLNIHFEFEAEDEPKQIEIYIGGYFLASVNINDISRQAKEYLFESY